MKKLLICVAMMAWGCIPLLADELQKKPVVINILIVEQHSQDDEIPRSPIRRLSLFVEDHTLSFSK